ncbi:Laminin G domain [Trinorchestia longiramus]|nr:Laminin G domain [Trinorchestia longiramus]
MHREEECACAPLGSRGSACEAITGQCNCKPNVVGRDCSRCAPGHWGLASVTGCRKCDCDGRGSAGGRCDEATGQCICAPGVGGERCDKCLPGYWGFSAAGCQPCEPCGVAGRSCDPYSGRCICPLNTEGDRCERCKPGSWDYSSTRGCKLCQCSTEGSVNQQCDFRTGRCSCKSGFRGAHCDQCTHGYYGAPSCRACDCDPGGTRSDVCEAHGRCQCDQRGQCPCKPNATGRRCDRCRGATFGLDAENPLGCTQCFCFKRTDKCQQAPYTWSQVTFPQRRVLGVEYGATHGGPAPPHATVIVRPWDTSQICYINLALPGERHLSTDRTRPEPRLNVTNQLHVIPGTPAHIVLGTATPFPAPLYWTLPKEFMRDKVRSYNGYLQFRVDSSGGTRVFPENILQTYPLVSLQGNWQLVLEHFPRTIEQDGTYRVRLHEDHWRLKGTTNPVTREQMMIALQNIQHILIRATHSEDVVAATLSDVTLDVATEGTLVSSRTALGVEQCFCPSSYIGTSCQNPNQGFFRWYKDNFIQSTIIIDLVGESRPCNCNGRSDECDQETGVCLNCRDNTAGHHCELCASGYYGDPRRGPCRPCACPTLTQNFAETCEAHPVAGYICHCKEGYTGDKCDSCAFGWYGRPSQPGGRCVPCKCDPHGSLHEGCDASGRCTCKAGIMGHDCSQCAPRHVVVDTGCKSCVDGCVDVLLDEIEELIRDIDNVNKSQFIPPPWPALRKIEKEYHLLRTQLNQYSTSDSSSDMEDHMRLEFSAKDLLRRARQLEEDARNNQRPATKTRDDAKALMDDLAGVNKEISDAISLLTNYAIGETASISVAGALEEARDLLKSIQNREAFQPLKIEAEMELQKAKDLLERMLAMQLDREHLIQVSGRYVDVRDNIREMLDIIRAADTKVDRADIINGGIKARLDRMSTITADISEHQSYIRDINYNSSALLRDAERNLNRTNDNYQTLELELPQLREYSARLSEQEASLHRRNSEYRTTYVEPAHDHALALTAKAIQLERLFNATRVGAVGPLKAAQAYQRIVDALRSAEEAARNASDAAHSAFQVAYPGDPSDSLVRKAKASRQSSNDLGTKGSSLLTKVDTLQKDLMRQQDLLAGARFTLSRTSDKLTGVNTAMDTQLNSDMTENILSALRRTEETHSNIDDTMRHVSVMHNNLTRFLKFASDINDFDASIISDIRKEIAVAESSTMKGRHLTTTLHVQADRIQTASEDLSERIRALRQKIRQTRQHASSIRVSVTPDEEEVCVRRYSPALQSSTTNTLVLSYAINTQKRDALILYFGNNNGSEFVAVEMLDRRIQVTWDVGGGAQTLQHPLQLLTNTPTVSEDKRWYHVDFRRVGNIGQLQVRPANTEGLPLLVQFSEPVTAQSPPGYTNINLPRGSSGVWLGGAPPLGLERLSTSEFAGCLHYATIDGANLGLWNFTSNQGCAACNEGVELITRQEDEIAFGFNGKGYFRGEPQPFGLVHRRFYSVVLAFKTLDEHALLFLVTDEQKDQLISITVEEGHVVLRVHFDDRTRLVMKSSKRLNNIADMTTITATIPIAAMDGKRMAQLAVGGQSQLATVSGGADLDLDDEPFYFGGVDPQFNKKRWGDEVVLRSMLGCMSSLSVRGNGHNPFTDGQFYGIDNACSEKPLDEVGFVGGEGFIELASQELRRDSSFGFTFQTMEANALLLLSTFVGQPLPEGVREHPPDFYSVSLVEGHLDLRLYAGNNQHRLLSRETFNDGRPHSFFVLRENRKVTLLVNDQAVNTTRLDRRGVIVQGPRQGGLYFGGVLPGLDIVAMVGSTAPFKGCIRDVIVNNKVVSFTRPKRFQGVYIGRCGDLPANAIRGMEGDVKDAEACQPPTQHTLEYGALKFGDQPSSHALIPVPKATFATDFSLSFEFRTHYPNALFLHAEPEPQGAELPTHRHRRRRPGFLTVNLQNGRLVVTTDGRRRDPIALISRASGLNSGQWKKVLVEKTRKSLRLTVDAGGTNKVAVPRRIVKTSQVYIGGLTQALREANRTQPMDPLRGCFRNMVVNEERWDIPQMARPDHLVGVGQCFAHVQPGSYFPGDAYAIYSSELSIGPLLEFALEFRTWELNGVLLAIADAAEGTSLALELINGAVVLNVTVDKGHSFGARVGFRNRFSLCDNSWHAVRAHFVKDSITLRVDDQPEAYGFNGVIDSKRVWVEGPLYIGGLPEYAPQGSLKSRDNFRGCIRNMVLDSSRTDWTDMYRLHNVLLNACPVY